MVNRPRLLLTMLKPGRRGGFAIPLRYSAKALVANRAGAAASEFALMLPLMLTMIFGTLQVGMFMYAYNQMVSTARDTVRAMAVCTITDMTTAADTARANLVQDVPWTVPTDWTVTPAQTGSDVGMTISIDPARAAIIAYLPFALNALQTHVEMTLEPLAYSGGGQCGAPNT